MKKHIAALMIAGAGLFASCSGFLDRQPLADIPPDQYFNSEKELEIYTNSFYSAFPNAEGVYNEDIDNVVKNSLSDLIIGRRTVPVTGGNWTWTELRKINYFLANYNKNVPEKDGAKHAAVAKFFRAYFYFDKVVRFGDVPWVNEVIEQLDTTGLKRPRDPRKLVMDSVLKDIDYAIANLPANVDPSKVTKWTALALKSRLCLFEGTYRKYHHTQIDSAGAARFLKECVSASEALMAGPYSIYRTTPEKSYLELFASQTPIPQEIILARSFSNDLQIWHNLNYYTITSSYGKPGLDKQLVNSYLMNDGTPFTDIPGYDTITFYNETRNRDPRLSQTVRTPGYTRIGSTNILPPDFGATVTGYQLIKYVTDQTSDSYNRSTNAMPIFRYAEVLLNFAEAKAELGDMAGSQDNLTQADLDRSIKLLRDRVGMPGLSLSAANTTPDPYMIQQYPKVTAGHKNRGVVLEIRRERRIELVMESFRWNDLLRWMEGAAMKRPFKGMYFPGPGLYDLDQNGSLDIAIYEGTKPTDPLDGVAYYKLGSEIVLENNAAGGNVVINRSTVKNFDEEKDYLQPIPIQERQLNPKLTQNPKWDDGIK